MEDPQRHFAYRYTLIQAMSDLLQSNTDVEIHIVRSRSLNFHVIKGNSGGRKNLSISVTDNLYIRFKSLLSMSLLTFLS